MPWTNSLSPLPAIVLAASTPFTILASFWIFAACDMVDANDAVAAAFAPTLGRVFNGFSFASRCSAFFSSGFCALVYQMAWLREFRLFFGASTAATAAVLAIFMGGLGFGSVILGRRSETKERPLAFYAQLELFVAASAALSPALLWATRQIYLAMGGTLAIGLGLGMIFRPVSESHRSTSWLA